jgi:hypothetical protein
MANAFLPLARLGAAFRAHWSALAPRHAVPHAAPHRALPAGAGCPVLRPLRVVRVLEPAASRSTAGRMVISGRLADVCAELERLAALEARGC